MTSRRNQQLYARNLPLAVLRAFGNDLSVRSLINFQELDGKSKRHSIILLLYCFKSAVT